MVYGAREQLTEPEVGSASADVYSSRTTEPSLASLMEATRRLESVASLVPNSQSGVALAFFSGILLGFAVGVLFQ